jgi:GNAT superfamily N-acetyltransferase
MIEVRKGIKSDLPAVLQLIKELAEYEKAPLEVSNTLEKMEEDGFGANKIFDFFVADSDCEIVGMALYYTKYSTWKGKCLFLEDIIVTEKCRNQGIGKLLFEQVIQVAKNEKMARMEWQVLTWNEPAISFYKKYNAIFDNEWFNVKFTDTQLYNFI